MIITKLIRKTNYHQLGYQFFQLFFRRILSFKNLVLELATKIARINDNHKIDT